MKTLTTGDIAKYCDVNFRTVIRWIDKGYLKSFKLPGRGNNRILLIDFLSFLKQQKIPVPEDFRHYLKRVLIIDDDKMMARSIERVIKTSGYKTKVVNDSFQAGAEINLFMPSTITLDIQMPGVDGWQVLEYIRKIEIYKRIKVIVISALPEEQLSPAIERGADAVLSKPFDNDDLLALIKLALIKLE